MTTTAGRRRPALFVAVVTLFASILVMIGGVASAGHGATMSTGIYRIPYADGTVVGVGNDSHNHNNAYDMSAGQDSEIVAAASGWIRGIVDHHGEEPGAGDGLDAQDPPQPQDDTLEHACGNNDPENTVATSCGDHNNYVWIEHPNGEYTKYSHLGTGTVSANWTEGDWIDAGEVIGLENDIGAASTANGEPGDRAFHLHFEVAAPNDPSDDLVWSELGGFIQNGTRRPATICDIADNDLLAGNDYTANPCNHQPPTADADGPHEVDEGSTVQLDGTGSTDPENNPLTYVWAPDTNLDDPALAQPTYSGIDDIIDDPLTLTVYDQIEALSDSDMTSVTVLNVPPMVTAVGDSIDEGDTATVSATFTDPGELDTHTATIDWDDGTAPEPVVVVQGVGEGSLQRSHVYGDNGVYNVKVSVTDDDGGVGMDTVAVVVANLNPELTLDTGDAVSFPGGDYFVGRIGEPQNHAASAQDAGSDDLTFMWGFGPVTTYFNDGVAPDPPKSPHGVFPFFAADDADVDFVLPGAFVIDVTVTDDDGGSASADLGKVVTGDAETTEGNGWWKHQYSGQGNPQVEDATLQGYLDVVNAVSSVFSEATVAATLDDVHDILSPNGNDRRVHATADLMAAWLHFASGAVAWDAPVPLEGGGSIPFLDAMHQIEATILDGAATDAELLVSELLAQRVRHAG